MEAGVSFKAVRRGAPTYSRPPHIVATVMLFPHRLGFVRQECSVVTHVPAQRG
jgi:hypothetical protein